MYVLKPATSSGVGDTSIPASPTNTLSSRKSARDCFFSLFNEEKIKVDRITGHGGLFRTKGVGQRILAAAINSPISVMETAGEGGAWGIALLGSYLLNNEKKQS